MFRKIEGECLVMRDLSTGIETLIGTQLMMDNEFGTEQWDVTLWSEIRFR